ncbi:Uridylate kinase [Trichinella pseudospiralis]
MVNLPKNQSRRLERALFCLLARGYSSSMKSILTARKMSPDVHFFEFWRRVGCPSPPWTVALAARPAEPFSQTVAEEQCVAIWWKPASRIFPVD